LIVIVDKAEFWVMIDTYKKELQQVKTTVYVHETGYRMVKCFLKNRLDETEEAFGIAAEYTEEVSLTLRIQNQRTRTF
jgi:hypothetical protein